ncbi:MAG: dinitrogenase iron-molybdenum cofactor biosynthesis protein [Clostridia bacterium]|nr:dinitrogenase iron-molybdenum cofactor biosynthesis protein [Clostridia bacterium]
MRIAVTYDNGEVCRHFGHSARFKLYEAEGGRIVAEQVVETGGSGHDALAGFLHAAGVDALICGGIETGAQEALAARGIRVCAGIRGSADEAARSLAAETLAGEPGGGCGHCCCEGCQP